MFCNKKDLRKMSTSSPFVGRITQWSEKFCRSLLDPALFCQAKFGKRWATTVSRSTEKLQSWPDYWFESENRSVVFDSLQPHGLYSPWSSPAQNPGVSSCSLLQGNLPNPGIELRSPALQEDSLPAEPPGKPKNTGKGSLSFFQGIFRTQEYELGSPAL